MILCNKKSTVIQLSYEHFLRYSVLESFEEVVALYAQQLLNETRTFTAPSLVVVAESVSL